MGPPTASGRPARRLRPPTSPAVTSISSSRMRATTLPRRRRALLPTRFLPFTDGERAAAFRGSIHQRDQFIHNLAVANHRDAATASVGLKTFKRTAVGP